MKSDMTEASQIIETYDAWNAPSAIKQVFINKTSGHKKRTALHYAASNGMYQLAAMLLIRGANPRITDEDGHTAGYYLSREAPAELKEALGV